MNYFYKLPTKFEDTNPIYYINLLSIQSISIELEYPNTNVGYLNIAYLVINGTKYLYDSVSILVKNKMTTEEIEQNDKRKLEFKRIKARLEMIVQDIMEKAQLCHQKSNKIETVEKTEKEDIVNSVIERIKQYCEDKYNQYKDENHALAGTQRDFAAHILNIINGFCS